MTVQCTDRPIYNPIFLGEPDDIVWGMAYHIGNNISILLFSSYNIFFVIRHFRPSACLFLYSYCNCKNNIYTFDGKKLRYLYFSFVLDDKDWLNGVRDQLDYREKVF